MQRECHEGKKRHENVIRSIFYYMGRNKWTSGRKCRKRPMAGGQWQDAKPSTPMLLAEISLGLGEPAAARPVGEVQRGLRLIVSWGWGKSPSVCAAHGPVAPGFVMAPDTHCGTDVCSWWLKAVSLSGSSLTPAAAIGRWISEARWNQE